MLKSEVDNNLEQMKKSLGKMGRVAVAFSGGIDSAFLLKIALDVLGKARVLAITCDSEVVTPSDRQYISEFTDIFDINHIFLGISLLEISEFIKNTPDRCYICKKYLFTKLMDTAGKNKISYLLDGQNLDDLKDYRPGALAAKELGVKSPLKNAGFTKKMIRRLSRSLKIPQWNRPSDSCLATRIPYGRKITKEKLEKIAKSEEFLKKMGFSSSMRVRHYGDTAKIETDPSDFEMIIGVKARMAIIEYFKKLGFKFVTLDLEGYRMGSLGEI